MPNPIQQTNNVYQGVNVPIDNQNFHNCRFTNCRLVYAGGELPILTHCTLINSNFFFDEAAARTLVFLRHVYHGMGDGGRNHIEEIFAFIRQDPQLLDEATSPRPS
jgi:hypothetical protein